MNVINTGKGLIKAWNKGVTFDDNTKQQLLNLADLPFIHKWVASMPDAHLGKGCAIGTVLATKKAIIPASVGVDLGCGMKAVKTSLKSSDLPDNLHNLRTHIESVVPVGRGQHNEQKVPDSVKNAWNKGLLKNFTKISDYAPIAKSNSIVHLGTLGGGNHFIEICIEEADDSVWVMLHSGSRGVGNAIGRYFISKAKEEMSKYFINLVDDDLAYLPENSKYFDQYIESVNWAQEFAKMSRDIMMQKTLDILEKHTHTFNIEQLSVDCHHNYVQKENHYKENVWVTRKGAVSARKGEFGIIPSSMGQKSFIVRGLGNPESFNSCSHGSGRVMSRTAAKKLVSAEEHKKSLEGVECNNTESTLDETPSAYKPIDDVMNAQKDLIEVVHEIKQVLCIKG